jgi:hypothetical protein
MMECSRIQYRHLAAAPANRRENQAVTINVLEFMVLSLAAED